MKPNKPPDERKSFLMYCALCWQEFDHLSEHNSGSFHDGQRLNGHCAGDIRSKEFGWRNQRIKREPPPRLDLDSAEPIEIQ